jgi:hypothetical protein
MEELCKIMRGPRRYNRSTASPETTLFSQDLTPSNLYGRDPDRLRNLGVRGAGYGLGATLF